MNKWATLEWWSNWYVARAIEIWVGQLMDRSLRELHQ